MHIETETTKPGTERVQALADISRSPYMLSCAPVANPPNSAKLGGAPPTVTPSYIRVRAVWASGRGQIDRQTDDTDARDHYKPTFRVVYDSREM